MSTRAVAIVGLVLASPADELAVSATIGAVAPGWVGPLLGCVLAGLSVAYWCRQRRAD